MKITKEDYATIKREIARLVLIVGMDTVREYGKTVSETMLRWELLRGTGLMEALSLHDYLEDDHIDTALRKIVKRLGVQEA